MKKLSDQVCDSSILFEIIKNLSFMPSTAAFGRRFIEEIVFFGPI